MMYQFAVGAAVAAAACAAAAAHADSTVAAVRHVSPGRSIARTISDAGGGDTIVVHAGSYPRQFIAKAFSVPVIVRAASGETVRIAGIHFANPSSNIILSGVTINPSSSVEGIMFTDGTKDITVSKTKIAGGKFGVRFTAGASTGWPRNIRIEDSEITNAYADNVQVSGARDVTFEGNWIHDPQVNGQHNDGIQSIASDGLQLYRNVFSFRTAGANGPNQAIILGRADPAVAGRTVTRSEIVNNLIHHWWGSGITLAGTSDTLITNNTVVDSGISGQDSSLVLAAKNAPQTFGNANVRVTNNIFYKILIVTGGSRPDVETHNMVRVGGGGTSLSTTDPQFVDGTSYMLKPTSPAVNSANPPLAPVVDRTNLSRDSQPDRGAHELPRPST